MPQKVKDITMYDVAEVAQVLNMHTNTVLKKINIGDIKATKFKPRESYWVLQDELERQCDIHNMPADMIEYRLGTKSPKTGKKIRK